MTATGAEARLRWNHAALAVCTLAFAVYAARRQVLVGGCDQPAYLLQSLAFRGVETGWRPDPTVPFAAAQAPLCTVQHHGVLQALFLPGFPVLLALAGLMGLEFHVTPFLGAASGYALYLLVRDRSGPAIALGATVAFLASPLVIWGSTQLMSDVPAMAFPLFALLAARRGAPGLAGGLLGFCLAVRPTTLLFAPWLILERLERRAVIRGVAAALAVAAAWALFIQLRLGGFPPAYVENLTAITRRGWVHHAWFHVVNVAWMYAPVMALALLGLVLRPRVVARDVAWFALLVCFYGFWDGELTDWWQSRFILPAVPALFMSAATGVQALASSVPWIRWRRWGAVLVVAYSAWAVRCTPVGGYLDPATNHYRFYPIEAGRVARTVPPTALIGAFESAGTLRLYEHLTSFDWSHRDASPLIEWALAANRPVYALINESDLQRNTLAQTFVLTLVEREPTGNVLYRIRSPIRFRIDVGEASARPYLLEGWSGDEHTPGGSYVWAVGHVASIRWPESLEHEDTIVRIALWPYVRGAMVQTVTVMAAGLQLGRFDLEDRERVIEVRVPALVAGAPIELHFEHATQPAPEGSMGDHRPLAAAIDRVTFRSAR